MTGCIAADFEVESDLPMVFTFIGQITCSNLSYHSQEKGKSPFHISTLKERPLYEVLSQAMYSSSTYQHVAC
jgi:hypothetical protein